MDMSSPLAVCRDLYTAFGLHLLCEIQSRVRAWQALPRFKSATARFLLLPSLSIVTGKFLIPLIPTLSRYVTIGSINARGRQVSSSRGALSRLISSKVKRGTRGASEDGDEEGRVEERGWNGSSRGSKTIDRAG